MKILIYSTNGVHRDGITQWLIQAVSGVDRRGIEQVDTIAFPDAYATYLDQLHAVGVGTHFLPSRRKNPIAYALALRRLVRKHSYDIIHISGNSGTIAIDLLACSGAGVKARIVHSHNTQGSYLYTDKLLRPVMNALLTDRAACGHDAGKWLFGDAQFTVIPNGRDFGSYVFSPEARRRIRSELSIPDGCQLIGHVGNFNKQKNHRFLIEAFALSLKRNPDLRLVLIGEGDLMPVAQAQAQDLAIERNVAFLGRRTDVGELLCAFDVAVLPSLYEGFPNVAIEWQINGLPSLISSAVTEECAVTNLVRFLPAEDLSAWAGALADTPVHDVDRANSSNDAQAALREAGYEASASGDRLNTFYAAIARREGVL